jgi:hypothetical protein
MYLEKSKCLIIWHKGSTSLQQKASIFFFPCSELSSLLERRMAKMNFESSKQLPLFCRHRLLDRPRFLSFRFFLYIVYYIYAFCFHSCKICEICCCQPLTGSGRRGFIWCSVHVCSFHCSYPCASGCRLLWGG